MAVALAPTHRLCYLEAMLRPALLVLVAAGACIGAAPAAKPKPAAKPPTAAKSAAPAAAFNARDPASMTAILGAMHAQAEVAGHVDDTITLKVASPAGAFSVQF